MNRQKGYRLLAVALFFTFISLISRSIIYLVLSVAIATIIIFLLSNDTKAKKMKKEQTTSHNKYDKSDHGRFSWFSLSLFVIGSVLIAYGSLTFMDHSYFHTVIVVQDSIVTSIAIIIMGSVLVLVTMYIILKKILLNPTDKDDTGEIVCQTCQTKNGKAYLYCSGCGKSLKK